MCAAPTGSHFSAQGRSGNASKRPNESQYTAPSTPVQSSAEDTFTGMAAVSGFAGCEPNGSNSMPMKPVYPAPTSAGETEEFLAIASQGNLQQPQLTPTDNPVSAPANPLVAAKMANSAQTSSDAGLFPIQEVDKKNPGKNFDTTFSEPRSKKGGVVVAIVIILIVALVAGAYFYITNQEAAKAKEKLDSAIETLVSTDSVMSGVDAAVAQTISDGMASDSLSLALEQTTTTQNSLSSAETQANDALASRLTSEQSDAANAVLSSISARRSMLEAARQIQNASSTTAAAADTLDQVYALMDSAVSKYSYASQLWDAYLNGDEGINTQEIIDNETGAYNDTQQALQIVAQAKESVGQNPELDEKRKADLARGEEYVEVKLFKDNGRYKDPVFVAVNGENCVIERGVRVKIKRKFAEVLDNSDNQDYETSRLMDAKSEEFSRSGL